MTLTGTERQIFQQVPFQLLPIEANSRRYYYALRRLALLGLIQFSYKTETAVQLKSLTVELTPAGVLVAPPTVNKVA